MSEYLRPGTFKIHFILLTPNRDDVLTPLDSHPDDPLNASASTPGKTIPGTSLDSSSASSEDESFSRDLDATWSATATTTEIILTEAEKKRQEIINGESLKMAINQFLMKIFLEIFETEKNHVRILKVLHTVFMVPLEQSKAMSPELITLVFPPSLLVLKDWHFTFEVTLKQRWKEHNSIVKEIGDCLNVVS